MKKMTAMKKIKIKKSKNKKITRVTNENYDVSNGKNEI